MTATRKYQDVAEGLRQALAAGQWRPGERLPPERVLAEELGVPRATLREALIALEVEGRVEIRHASGIYVRAAGAAILPFGLRHDPADIGPFELLRARQVIESAVAASAALTVTEADLDQMAAALDQEEADIARGHGSYEGDERFHMLIAQSTQNPGLIGCVALLWSMRRKSELWGRLHTRIFNDDYRRAWGAQHREILTGLRKRDPESARSAMWRHLGLVSDTLLTLSEVEAEPGPATARRLDRHDR